MGKAHVSPGKQHLLVGIAHILPGKQRTLIEKVHTSTKKAHFDKKKSVLQEKTAHFDKKNAYFKKKQRTLTEKVPEGIPLGPYFERKQRTLTEKCKLALLMNFNEKLIKGLGEVLFEHGGGGIVARTANRYKVPRVFLPGHQSRIDGSQWQVIGFLPFYEKHSKQIFSERT